MRSRSLVAAAVAAAAGMLLAGCTFSVGLDTTPTVDAGEIEESAASALEDQTGVRPEIDCGEEPIPVAEDRTVTCLLVDPVAGLEFDVVITFHDVDGDEYFMDIRVADVAANAPEPTAEPGASVPISDLEALAIQALSTTLEYVPEVTCAGDRVTIVVGTTVECSYPSPEGVVDAVVTITEYDADAGSYAIRVD